MVIAPDKWRGSATAAEIAAAIAAVATQAGWGSDVAPVSDGGDGFSAVLGGRAHPHRVHDPLGTLVDAAWYLLDDGETATVEMALASGLALVGGPDGNDPIGASTAGTGELIAAAVKAGATQILIGMGGSATTDGGWGALGALEPHSRLHGIHLQVGYDVTTTFVDAAAVFSPQKGASPTQAQLLTRRLERLAQLYEERFGVDVRDLEGSGAAGGLAGGLAALGATLTRGLRPGGGPHRAGRADRGRRPGDHRRGAARRGVLSRQVGRGRGRPGRRAGVPVMILAGTRSGIAPVPYRTLVADGRRGAGLGRSAGAPSAEVAGQVAGRLAGAG